jgi:hypothetical protein
MEVPLANPKSHPDYASWAAAYDKAKNLRAVFQESFRVFNDKRHPVRDRREELHRNHNDCCQFCRDIDRNWRKAANAQTEGRYQEAHLHLTNLISSLDKRGSDNGKREVVQP